MRESTYEDYVAAAILMDAQGRSKLDVWQVNTSDLVSSISPFFQHLGLNQTTIEVALSILKKGGMAQSSPERDFAEKFHRIDFRRLADLNSRYLKEREVERKFLDDGIVGVGPISQEAIDFIRLHPVFLHYHNFGDQWLRSKISGFDKSPPEFLTFGHVPASDRIVKRDDNRKKYSQIEDDLAILVDLTHSNDNEIGQVLGDDRKILRQEFETAQAIVDQGSFRAASLLGWLSKALKFVMDKFSGTLVAETAKRLFEFLEGLF